MENSDKQVLARLVAKCACLFLEKGADEALKAQVEARLAARAEEMQNFHAAFKLYGFNGLTTETWNGIKALIGQQAYQMALNEGTAIYNQAHGIELQNPLISHAIENKAAAIEVSTIERPKIRELVLAQLKAAGDEGDGATAIRKRLETRWNMKLHEKTVGMTLYRLSKDNLARRDGRTWFFVPQPETKNPGDDAPGQSEVLN